MTETADAPSADAAATLSAPPPIDPRRHALFLDFDGTLAPFAATPDAVSVPVAIVETLGALTGALDGAIAIVTGRTLAEVDRYLAPLTPTAAAVHGLVVRHGRDGQIDQQPADTGALLRVGAAFDGVARGLPGVLVERKSHSVALHWRRAPEREDGIVAEAESIVGANPSLVLQRGKCVAEARTSGRDKGDAIVDLLADPVFAGRLPVFAGDDVTDERGFIAVNARDGVSIKVGDGPTAARFRLGDVAAVHAWLSASAAPGD
ncbi:MAG: trehalose-phosphatase [Pseudomonadota bacterium]